MSRKVMVGMELRPPEALKRHIAGRPVGIKPIESEKQDKSPKDYKMDGRNL